MKDIEEFIRMRDNEEWLENAHVFGNYYGTPKEFVFEQLVCALLPCFAGSREAGKQP